MGKRVILIVMDSFGVGALPDAPSFGDVDVNTIASCMKRELTDTMTTLATEAASLYIAPLHQNMPSRFEGSEILPVFRREVEGRA